MTSIVGEALTVMPTVINTKDIGKMKKEMGKAFILGKVAKNTKEISKMVYKTGQAPTIGQMEIGELENGNMGKNMERELIIMQLEKRKSRCGKTMNQ